jgi:hypothetical protein
MTTQRVAEEVAYMDLDAEMEQMRQFTEGVTTGDIDPAQGGNDGAPENVSPPSDVPPEEEKPDELEEGEEDDGAGLIEEAEGEEEAEEGAAPEPAPDQNQADIQFHEREVELMQREAAAKAESTAAQVAVRNQQLNQAQVQLSDAIKTEYGMDDNEAGRLAAGIRQSWDAYHTTQDKVAEFTDWYRTGVRTSYVLGQQYGVDPKVLFPDEPDHLISFKEMKAKAEELGGNSHLKRENQKLREASAPRQQFARSRGTTSGRSQTQLVDSGLQKPERERTPQEKEAIRREATGS